MKKCEWFIISCRATQWFLVLRKNAIAQTALNKPHDKPLSDHYNPFSTKGAVC
jgi:hypothetical protein